MGTWNLGGRDGIPIYEMPIYDERTASETVFAIPGVNVEGRLMPTRDGLLSALGVMKSHISETLGPLDIGFDCGLVIKPESRQVTISSVELPDPLTFYEFDLLHFFAKGRGKLYKPETVVKELWPTQKSADNILRIQTHRLREKLDASIASAKKPAGPNVGLIRVMRGAGIGLGHRAFDPEPLVLPRLREKVPRKYKA